MTTSHTPCPDCHTPITHAETMTDLSGLRSVTIVIHTCPDCGYKWQTTSETKQPEPVKEKA